MQYSDPNFSSTSIPSSYNGGGNDDDLFPRNSTSSGILFDPTRPSCEGSPMMMSPWNQTGMFNTASSFTSYEDNLPQKGLIGSLVREEGHIYSLAAKKDLLYTGSDSKNIRVWKNLKEFSAFKSSSGLVKAIIISGEKIFTGHQDGKIRVWKVSPKAPNVHKRLGTLPTLKDIFKSSIRPSNYVQNKNNKSVLWIKHSDAVSCLSLNEDQTLLYSASWDRTFKVWRISDSKCVESVNAHDDTVNSVVASLAALVFTGSADGTVKVWKREAQGKVTKHTLMHTLLKQECAVTALAVSVKGSVVYCGSSDGLVNYWEVEKGLAHGGTLNGHKLAVLCLAAAGNLVFSGSADKAICSWRRDGNIHTCITVLTGHTGPVKCLTVEENPEPSKNGENKWIVYSGSLDKSVNVWSVSDYDLDAMMPQQQQQQVVAFDGDSLPSDGSSRAGGRNRMY